MREEYLECPKCGNIKHHEIIRVETEGRESRLFRCKSCGHREYDFREYDPELDRAAVERMGDAFREFLGRK